MKIAFYIPIAIMAISTSLYAQEALTVDFVWKTSHQCSPSSPEIKVSGIPIGTKSLNVTLHDNDMRSFNHGGGYLAASGEATFTIPAGALKNYTGPCPPNFSSFGHDYEFTVDAIAEDGKTVLGRGRKQQTFSASTVKN